MQHTDIPAAGATPTVPVRPVVATRATRGGPARWLIALTISVLVIAVSAGGFALLSAGAATSSLVGYVPAGSVAYLEVRLDPPGDQRQNVSNVIAKFPGFADQSILDTKLDQALDELSGRVGDGSVLYTRDIKPWLGDSLAVAATRLPASKADKAGLVLIAVTNPDAAGAWALKKFGPGTATSTYNGVSLTTVTGKDHELVFGVTGDVLLAGDLASVKAAIDTKGASQLAASSGFAAALASVPGDQLAFGYVDLAQVRALIVERLPAPAPSAGPAASAATAALQNLPDWLAFSVRAESDGLVATVAAPNTGMLPVKDNHVSTLATRLPSSTIVAGEVHDLAAYLGPIAARLPIPTDGAQGSPGQLLESIGGVEALIGWMGDATLAVVRDGDAAALGAIVKAADAATAETKLLQLKNLVALAGGSAGITVRTETYAGATITIFDAGPVGTEPVREARGHLPRGLPAADRRRAAGRPGCRRPRRRIRQGGARHEAGLQPRGPGDLQDRHRPSRGRQCRPAVRGRRRRNGPRRGPDDGRRASEVRGRRQALPRAVARRSRPPAPPAIPAICVSSLRSSSPTGRNGHKEEHSAWQFAFV